MSKVTSVDVSAEETELKTAPAAQPLEQGRKARKGGNLAGALEYFRAAKKAVPNSVVAQCEMAQTLDLLGQPLKAVKIYKKVLDQAPDNVRALIGFSLVSFKLNAREDALTALEKAIPAAEGDPKKMLHVAEAFWEISEPTRAAEILRSVVRTGEGKVRTRAVRLLANLSAGLTDQAAVFDALGSAATDAPDDPRIQFRLAEAICLAQPDWTQRGQSREEMSEKPEHSVARARAILEELAARQEGTWKTKALVLLARIARYEHRWDDALTLFEKAAAAEPDNINLLCQVGIALSDLSRPEEAKRQFELVLSKSPDNIEAILGLGDIAKLHEDFKGALLEYERAAALEPTNTAVHARLRSLQGRVGRFDWQGELDSAIHVVQTPDRPKGALVKAANVLLRYGVTDVLRPAMGELEEASAAGRQIAAAVRALERAGLARTRAQLEDRSSDNDGDLDEMAGAVSKLVPGSETLLVIFGGAAGQIDITFSLFHRLLRATGTSALFARDIEETRYVGGIVGLGHDFDSTVTALRRVAEQSGAKRLLMMGNCQGAGAAIRYGVAAGAEAVLGFDPRIGLPNAESLKPADANRISQALTRYAGVESVDETYKKATNKPRLTLIYDTNREPYATRVRDLGSIEGVTVAGIPLVRSPMLRVLLVEGLLAPIMNEFVADGRLDEKLLEQLGSLSKK